MTMTKKRLKILTLGAFILPSLMWGSLAFAAGSFIPASPQVVSSGTMPTFEADCSFDGVATPKFVVYQGNTLVDAGDTGYGRDCGTSTGYGYLAAITTNTTYTVMFYDPANMPNLGSIGAISNATNGALDAIETDSYTVNISAPIPPPSGGTTIYSGIAGNVIHDIGGILAHNLQKVLIVFAGLLGLGIMVEIVIIAFYKGKLSGRK